MHWEDPEESGREGGGREDGDGERKKKKMWNAMRQGGVPFVLCEEYRFWNSKPMGVYFNLTERRL